MPEVRRALREDAEAISGILADCFADDPVVNLMLPGDELRKRYFRETFLETYLAHELSTLSPGLEGAALWLPPGEREREPSLGFGAAWAFRVATRRGIAAFFGLQRAASFVKSRKPPGPHFYLHAVGVRKEHRGRGIARALLAPCLELCDRTGAKAYLENSRESNLPFYEKLGFEVVEVLDPEEAGARIWLMTRRARTEKDRS